jgi:hypothetical protein
MNESIRIPVIAGLLASLALNTHAASGDAPASPPTQQDFAYGTPFTTEGQAAAFIAPLPQQVYEGIARSDFSDIAVFNERGELVPHVLQLPRTHSTVQQPAVPFPVFVLRGNETAALNAIRVTIDAGGAKVDVTPPASGAGGAAGGTVGAGAATTAGSASSQPAAILGYVLDGRALESSVAAFQLGWAEDAPQFAGRLKVEASDDLGYWQTLIDAAPIANLRAGDSRLIERRVETPRMSSKFWRLSWVGERAPFEITSVTAEPAGNRENIGRPSFSVAGMPVAAQAGEFTFDLNGRFPVDRVNLELPESNSVVEVELLSRSKSDGPWRHVTRSGFYRLRSASAELVNGDISVAPNSDRYWLARVDVRDNGLGSGQPKLRVAWAPHEVVFLARGQGPFVLAHGNAATMGATGRIAALPKGAHILPATLGERTMLGGEARLAAARDAFPSKSVILWTVLGLGVALLAYMAFRLSRELKR